MKRQIIKADGSVVNYSPASSAHYELKELQNIVGGYIQIIELGNGWQMVIAEEGKLKGMPYNAIATDLAQEHEAIFENDYIVGDVLICMEGDIL